MTAEREVKIFILWKISHFIKEITTASKDIVSLIHFDRICVSDICIYIIFWCQYHYDISDLVHSLLWLFSSILESTHAHNFIPVVWIMLVFYESGIRVIQQQKKIISNRVDKNQIIRIEKRDSRRQNNQTGFILNDNFVTECELLSSDQLSRFDSNIEAKLICRITRLD